MTADALHNAIHDRISMRIAENYESPEGCMPDRLNPSAVATIATPAALAAIEEEGYVIVRAEDIHGVLGPKRGVRAYIEAGRRLLDSAEHLAQPSGTIQDAREGGPGISGCSDDRKGAASLSAPHGWNRTQDANSRTLLWKVVDSGDLIVGAPLATPITEEKPDA